MKIKSIDDLKVVSSVVKDAFQVSPWNIEDMPDFEINLRLDMFSPGQRFILAAVTSSSYQEEKELISIDNTLGISWFGIPKEGELPGVVVQKVLSQMPNALQVYYGATAVRREFQSKGIAKTLKESALVKISRLYPGCVLITRMRSDNERIIRINRAHGFVPSGIIETSQEGVRDEWWFKSFS